MTTLRSLFLYLGLAITFLACKDTVVVLEREDPPPCQGMANTIDVQICEGQSYTLPNGEVVSEAGTYTVVEGNGGCDNTTIVTVSTGGSFLVTQNAGICEGEEYELPDGTFVEDAGTYESVFQSSAGCDSVIVTNLTLNDLIRIENDVTICECSDYELPDGVVVTEEGTYESRIPGNLTCDTIYTTNVSFLEVEIDEIEEELCEGDQFQLPITFDIVDEPKTYLVEVVPSVGGCDSILRYVHLVSRDSYMFEQEIEAPNGSTYVLPDGTAVTTTGEYDTTLETASGCDSTFVQNVTFNANNQYKTTWDQAICDNEEFTLPDGTVVNTADTYNVTIPGAGGVDSIFTINLSVLPTYEIQEEVTIQECSSYDLPGGIRVYEAGTYESLLKSVNGCDSVIVTTVTVQ